MDEHNATGKRLDFARVLVISISSELLDSLAVVSKGAIFNQPVDYIWKPKGCSSCNTFNHFNGNCPLKQQDPKPSSKQRNGRWIQKSPKRQQLNPKQKDGHHSGPSSGFQLEVERESKVPKENFQKNQESIEGTSEMPRLKKN